LLDLQITRREPSEFPREKFPLGRAELNRSWLIPGTNPTVSRNQI